MTTRALSPREEEIVDLCIDGLNNEQISDRLGLSIGTVNTYWIRIKQKVGGLARADTVAKILKERADLALSEEKIDWKGLEDILAKRESFGLLADDEKRKELNGALSLLQLAMDQNQSVGWVTDQDLVIQSLANGLQSTSPFDNWEIGKTLYEVFQTKDQSNPAISAHVAALDGRESEILLTGKFANMVLKTRPYRDGAGESAGCISILTTQVAQEVELKALIGPLIVGQPNSRAYTK